MSAPTAPEFSPRSARRGLLLLVCGVVLIPIIAAVLQLSTGGWVPEGDDAWVARRTQQVGTSQPPLIGQESTVIEEPTVAGLSHPGPASYYIMAVPYGISGWSPIGLAIGAGLIVAAAATTVVLLAARTMGEAGALGAGVALTLLSASLGLEWLVRPTSSVLVVMPLLACMVGLANYLVRDRVGLLAVLGFGVFAMQTSLVVLPLSGLLVSSALIVALVRSIRTRTMPIHGWGWAIFGVCVVAWIPPLIDQFTRPRGNLGDLLSYVLGGGEGGTADVESAGALGFGPALASVVDAISTPLGIGGRSLSGFGVFLVELDEVGLIGPAVFGLCVVGAAAWGYVHRRRAVLALLGVAAAVTLVAIVAFSRRPTDSLLTPTYFVLWLESVAALWWIAIAVAAADAVTVTAWRWRPVPTSPRQRRRELGYRREWVARVAVVMSLVLAAVALTHPMPRVDSERVESLSRQIRSTVPPGTYMVEGRGLVAWASTAKGLGADLIAHGYDIRFKEFGGMPDEQQRATEPRIPRLYVVAKSSGGGAPVDGDLSVVAFTTDEEADVQVWFVPGGDYSGLCSEVALARVGDLPTGTGEGGRIEDPKALADLLAAIDVEQLAKDTGDADYTAAVEALREGRDETLTRLESTEPGTLFADLAAGDEKIGSILLVIGTALRECLSGQS